MRPRVVLTRKSFFVNERALRRAKKLLGVATDAEVVRASVDRIVEMETNIDFVKKSVPVGPLF